MKAVRILQFIVLLVVAGYLFLIHNENPNDIFLPFLPSLPTAIVLALALVVGWLAGWLPARVRIWQLNRENRRLKARLEGLEPTPYHDPDEPSAPIIPDRDTSRSRSPSHRSETENI